MAGRRAMIVRVSIILGHVAVGLDPQLTFGQTRGSASGARWQVQGNVASSRTRQNRLRAWPLLAAHSRLCYHQGVPHIPRSIRSICRLLQYSAADTRMVRPQRNSAQL